MPRPAIKRRIVGRYFTWLLGRRNGVYYADGRSNVPALGRHSLGTRDETEALAALARLDLVRAVDVGRADRAALDAAPPEALVLEQGRALYEAHVARPRVTGGARPSTAKRYRAVLDKFTAFCRERGVTRWDQITRAVLEGYAAWLDAEGYAYASEYLELTTLKQALKWFVEVGRLPASCLFRLPLTKPQGTDTYCWTPEEVRAIVAHCAADPELAWLGQVLTALACTGLRISELAGLRWSDIDLARNTITLTDEGKRGRYRERRKARETKTGRSRAFPIHPDLRRVLEVLPRHPDGLVFHGARGGILKPDRVRRAEIRDVLDVLADRFPTPAGEIGFRDGRLHSFRHYFCSCCANSGVPEQVVMQWLGHRQSAMVRHYYHLHDAEAQRQMRRLDFISRSSPAEEQGGASAASEPSSSAPSSDQIDGTPTRPHRGER